MANSPSLPELPAGATAASWRRLGIAAELAALCPESLGREIAVAGSVSLGIADEASDIELNFWCDVIPSLADRLDWLERSGVTDLNATEVAEGDGSRWTACRFRGVWVEAGWQSIDVLTDLVDRILAGEATIHDQMMMASTIVNAASVRTDGIVARWQQRLAIYPDSVQRAVIEANTSVWQMPHASLGRWAMADRGDLLSLNERFLWDMSNVLRVLYALNRRWDPDWKWLRPKVADLPIAPERLADRIDEIFSAAAAHRRVVACQSLILDTLKLVPETPGIARARAAIGASLSSRSEL